MKIIKKKTLFSAAKYNSGHNLTLLETNDAKDGF